MEIPRLCWLATMFWPESDGRRGRANLRRTLYHLNQELGNKVLKATDETIARDPEADIWIDVEAFQKLSAAPATMIQATNLYQDDFLAGFTLPDCPAFDEWQFFEREGLQQRLAQFLIELTQVREAEEEWEQAIVFGRRWLALDPLHEPAHALLMRLYALSGRQAAALRQYEECVRLLDEELGVEPQEPTRALYEAIHSREVGAAVNEWHLVQGGASTGVAGDNEEQVAVRGAKERQPSVSGREIPSFPTPFIGREQDLQRVQTMLADPGCRLVTLTGPGGIGKTRLAAEATRSAQDAFTDGAYFVPLQPLSPEQLLASAIADGVGCPVQGEIDTVDQLLAFLQGKRLLITLDNFEHLLEVTPLLVRLLDAVPGVKLLVTSRELLNLRSEWVWPVTGLRYPDAPEAQPSESDSAVHLFASCARRLDPEFSLEDEGEQVVAICKLVEGIPLAIELAAAWVRTLSCEAITQEIRRNLDFLDGRLRDVPARHRSLRAVFDQSWQMLSGPEREAFKRLAVFQGGFSRKGAQTVAGASLAILGGLLDKSMVWQASGERYLVHDLLRQYALEQLQQDPDELERVYQQHAEFHLHFLASRSEAVTGGEQQRILQEVTPELENIRVAWPRLLAYEQAEVVQQAVYCMGDVFNFSGRYLQGAQYFEQAMALFQQMEDRQQRLPAYLEVLCCQGWFHMRLGELDAADNVLRECALLLAQHQLQPTPGLGTEPLTALSYTHLLRGQYAEALELGEQARIRSERAGDEANLGVSYYMLTAASLALGELEKALRFAQAGVALTRRINNDWFLAYCLNELGNIARVEGDYTLARRYHQESYDIRSEFRDLQGMADALNGLAAASGLEQSYEEAISYFQESLALYRQVGSDMGRAAAKKGLGAAYHGLGQIEAARVQLLEALDIAEADQLVPPLLSVLATIGDFLLTVADAKQGEALLHRVLHHPMATYETRAGAQRLLAGCSYTPVERAPLEKALILPGAAEVAHLVNSALASYVPSANPDVATAEIGILDADTLLAQGVEPLSERELEVLHHLATGMTNREIAEVLVVAVGTIKTHTHHIYGKLGVKNRTEAAQRARELNLIDE